jgi:hypothetical protein
MVIPPTGANHFKRAKLSAGSLLPIKAALGLALEYIRYLGCGVFRAATLFSAPLPLPVSSVGSTLNFTTSAKGSHELERRIKWYSCPDPRRPLKGLPFRKILTDRDIHMLKGLVKSDQLEVLEQVTSVSSWWIERKRY